MAFENYSQRDPRWAGQRLGTCDGVTIGSDGCFVTAYANIAAHFSKDINPAKLDDIFTDRDFYVNGCLCTDSMLSRVYGDIRYIETFHFEGVPANFGVLVNTFEDEYVVEVDSNPNVPGVQTHFNRFYSYDANTGQLFIIDSWTGKLTDVGKVYGNPKVAVQKIIHYRGPGLPPLAPPPEPPKPAPPKPPTPPPHQDPVVVPPAQQPPEVTPPTAPPIPKPTPKPAPVSPIETGVNQFIDWLIQAIKNLFKKGGK